MTHYIDKDALVTGIKRKRDKYINLFLTDEVHTLNDILEFIDSLEVKEVDLNKEFDKYCDNLYLIDLENEPYAELFECAKYFFNLGLKLQKGE
jgi:hypothetical protein